MIGNPMTGEEILRIVQKDNFNGRKKTMAKNQRPASLLDLQMSHWAARSGTKPKKVDDHVVAGIVLGGNQLTTQRADEKFGKSEEVPGDLLAAFESEAAQ